jgi:hypothetical protein
MSVKNCLDSAHAAGEIRREERDAMVKLYDELVAHYGSADLAKAELVARLMREAEHKKRQGLLAEDARRKVETFVMAYRNARGEPDPAKALVYLIEHNGQVAMPDGMSSVVGRSNAIVGLSMAKMEEVLHTFRRTWVTGSTRETARLTNLVREAFGEDTGDTAAKGLAKAWSDVAEALRQRFNAAGGAIGKLVHWGMSQHHDRRALLRAGMETWIGYITPRLDLARMKHPLTGNAMTAADLRSSLEWIWRNITSDGWHERDPTAQRRGLGAISNQRAESRFLHFKNADAWLEYQEAFGGGADPFAAMMSHIRGMAEDVAAMEILGPNPAAMLTYLENFVTRQAALRMTGDAKAVFPKRAEYTAAGYDASGNWLTSKNPEDYARGQIRLARDMWDIHRGAAGAAVNQRMADAFGVVRNLNVASKLGGATLSAVMDLGFQHMARAFAGLPQGMMHAEVVKAFATGPKRDAVAAGLILDTALHVLHAEARWVGGMHGPAWSSYLADRVIAASGLQAWTQAGRHAFGLSFMAELARQAGKPLADLPPALQRTFRRYGLTAADWDAMRLDADVQAGRDLFLKPAAVERQMKLAGRDGERIGERYLEMILQETEYAVPQGTLQAKARAYGGLKRGTLRDEAFRSMGQFKMFGISVALLQGQRLATEMVENGAWRGAGYAAALLVTGTLYGALAMQMKQVAQGKDPRPMGGKDGWKFWGGAILQGGGAGIYGDFLASETNRMGGGLARTVIGPTGDLAASVLSLTSGNLAEYLRGEKTNTGREAVRFLGQNTPGGSLWYLRLAYERTVLDQLQKLADPEAHTAFRRRIENTQRDFGNRFFWAPGETGPRRAPNVDHLLRR